MGGLNFRPPSGTKKKSEMQRYRTIIFRNNIQQLGQEGRSTEVDKLKEGRWVSTKYRQEQFPGSKGGGRQRLWTVSLPVSVVTMLTELPPPNLIDPPPIQTQHPLSKHCPPPRAAGVMPSFQRVTPPLFTWPCLRGGPGARRCPPERPAGRPGTGWGLGAPTCTVGRDDDPQNDGSENTMPVLGHCHQNAVAFHWMMPRA